MACLQGSRSGLHGPYVTGVALTRSMQPHNSPSRDCTKFRSLITIGPLCNIILLYTLLAFTPIVDL
jgi:hypothetical protein